MNESDVKRKMVESVKSCGGYARRIEDQYAVGVFDTMFIPKGLPVIFAEVKIVRGTTFGPTPRQLIELDRVKYATANTGHAIPIIIGYKDGVYYFHHPMPAVDIKECFSVTTSDMEFHDQLVQYFHSRRK